MEKIHKNMTFGELLQSYPKAGPILAGYGLHCIGCHVGVTETIEEGCQAHGISEENIEKIMTELNQKAVD